MRELRQRLLAALLVYLCCQSAVAADNTIGILVFDKVLTSDIIAPAEVFGIAERKSWFASYQVKFIGVTDAATITTEEGITLQVDHSIADDIDLSALIVPSAYDMNPLLNNRQLIDFIHRHGERVKWLASNCSGAFLLGKAGLLDGRRATTWAGGEADLQRAYPRAKVLKDRNIVVDGTIITANGSLISYPAALVLLSMMSSPAKAKQVYATLQMERLVTWQAISHFIPDL
ncbi:DJ-1/PfpI family protein [Exilibacterium tricleocarpae]|uniref:DJ-1/PfpI family protein n=1 Tax=Exilibacterium tricleocarpae TaxID=2591008 RepID=A0A545TS40_9GAMM|nr:DJ-1/PfpI family protein [Exilibacterium tricleocarpae]TQV80035.1 DJ-1/PfpI family protein [Exilibacterium tricleocarpae]